MVTIARDGSKGSIRGSSRGGRSRSQDRERFACDEHRPAAEEAFLLSRKKLTCVSYFCSKGLNDMKIGSKFVLLILMA